MKKLFLNIKIYGGANDKVEGCSEDGFVKEGDIISVESYYFLFVFCLNANKK